MHFKNNFKVHRYKIVLAQTLVSKGVKSLGKQPTSTFHSSPKGMCIVKVTFWISSSASHLHLPGEPRLPGTPAHSTHMAHHQTATQLGTNNSLVSLPFLSAFLRNVLALLQSSPPWHEVWLMTVLENYKFIFCQHGQQPDFHMLAASSVFKQGTNHDTFPTGQNKCSTVVLLYYYWKRNASKEKSPKIHSEKSFQNSL